MLQIRNLFSIYFGLYSRGRRLSPAQEPDVARFPNGFLRVGSEKVQCQCHRHWESGKRPTADSLIQQCGEPYLAYSAPSRLTEFWSVDSAWSPLIE